MLGDDHFRKVTFASLARSLGAHCLPSLDLIVACLSWTGQAMKNKEIVATCVEQQERHWRFYVNTRLDNAKVRAFFLLLWNSASP